jgi:hypothetical protein
MQPPGPINWGGNSETALFVKEHPDLEIRVILAPADGSKPKVVDHMKGSSTTTKVGFVIQVNGNHYDVGYITAGPEVSRYVFSNVEAGTAVKAILAHLSKAQPHVVPGGAAGGDDMSLSDFIAQAEMISSGLHGGDAAWTEVEKQDRRRKQEKKRQKEKEEKEIVEKKKQEEKQAKEKQVKEKQAAAQATALLRQ